MRLALLLAAGASSTTQRLCAPGEHFIGPHAIDPEGFSVSPVSNASTGLRIGFVGDRLEPWQWPEDGTMAGFVPDVCRSIGNATLVPVGLDQGWSANISRYLGAADSLIRAGELDAAIAPVDTLWAEGRIDDFVVSLPYVNFHLVIAVLVGPGQLSLWRLFTPFTAELWGFLAAVTVGGALFALVVDTLRRSRTPQPGDLLRSLYHAFAALLGDSPDERLQESWPGRLLRIGVLLFVLIAQAAYTANLASQLTSDQLTVNGPRSLEELRCAEVCTPPIVANQKDVLEKWYVKKLHVADVRTPDGIGGVSEAYQECARLLRSGQVSAILGDSFSLHRFTVDDCGDVQTVSGIEILPTSWAFYVHRRDVAKGARLSAATLELMGGTEYHRLQEHHFKLGQACGSRTASSGALHPKQVGGLFIIFSGTCVIALGGAAVSCLQRRCSPQDDEPDEPPLHASERLLLSRLEEQSALLSRINVMVQLDAVTAGPDAPGELADETVDASEDPDTRSPSARGLGAQLLHVTPQDRDS
eukprot:TRINITY_DN65273_c0_g1_i1.p1 TRINITY_DN65273_c0_g1~~TRINITY_DN65273_c0_g1_i1.p1  ORF type:complete len:549 (+),score=99.22 TRINITY_DN65273_c0_g1_i1:62-1648(+)